MTRQCGYGGVGLVTDKNALFLGGGPRLPCGVFRETIPCDQEEPSAVVLASRRHGIFYRDKSMVKAYERSRGSPSRYAVIFGMMSTRNGVTLIHLK
jgi:hypothetical protein